MNYRIGIAAGLLSFVPLLAAAQSLPVPTMNIPEASSKLGFDWGLSTGFDYVTDAKCSLLSASVSCTSTGTSAFSIPSTLMAQFNRLKVEVTVPFVDIEGPGQISSVLGAPKIVASSSSTSPVIRRSGLGDVSVGAAFILMREGHILPRLELGGSVKAPTGANGLGTGKTDYAAQISLYRPLWDGVSTFGSVGYQWVGDTNTVQFHKGGRATAGLDANFSIFGVGALLDYDQSVVPGLRNSLTVDPYVTLRLFGRLGVQAYTTFGLTKSSPSHGVGVRVVFGSHDRA